MIMWPRLGLSHRLSIVFAVLLLTCCCASVWLQTRSAEQREDEVTQRLSRNLAAAIADNSKLIGPDGVESEAIHNLFGSLMVVNPSVEVYLLAPDGSITAQVAPEGHVRRNRVDLDPVNRFLRGDPMPILGDDPRSADARKVFSAAPLMLQGREAGYIYVMLQGEDREALAARVSRNGLLQTTLWLTALVTLLCLIAGLIAFGLTTRPLRQLTATVAGFDVGNAGLLTQASPALARLRRGNDEIALLARAFATMARRIDAQWQELSQQDRQRRELFANISHDLRTPLTSLHGYLETLLIKSESLGKDEHRRYLEIALGQSRKVGRLAQEVFELAKLEYGVVQAEKEVFMLTDLLQDVFQKFELAAEARQQRIEPLFAPALPQVAADLGMIERVFTNLLDNAIRHSPQGGSISVSVERKAAEVRVRISDSGPGLPPAVVENGFTRPQCRFDAYGGSGGLGLVIVQRILELHGSALSVVRAADRSGTTLEFGLPVAA